MIMSETIGPTAPARYMLQWRILVLLFFCAALALARASPRRAPEARLPRGLQLWQPRDAYLRE